jgi:hypothetical protein
MSSQAPEPAPTAVALSGTSPTTSSLPRLGPSWAYRAASSSSGSHKGAFQPPAPQIEGKDAPQQKQSVHRDPRSNSFSLLSGGDDDDDDSPSMSNGGGPKRCDGLLSGPSSSKQPLFQRSTSSGLRSTGGRSLAELAASAPPSTGRTASVGVGASLVRRSDSRDGGGSLGRSFAEDPDNPTTRYTREKLLAMRPTPCRRLPELLSPLEGGVVVSTSDQDPGERRLEC